MLKISPTNPYFSDLKRVRQKTSAHCAPAVMQMLLSFVEVEVDQEKIVDSAAVRRKLTIHGMTIPEMKTAVEKLAAKKQFWFKSDASIFDLDKIINFHKYPVGVEWQGVFYEDADEDDGHYSVITHIDIPFNIITLSDPYRRFAGTDRTFSILEFENRWWDDNEIVDPFTGKKAIIHDQHMMFIVTPKSERFPLDFDMRRE